ncbi:hypothetical protein VWM48_09910, partial [Campylobacter coli]
LKQYERIAHFENFTLINSDIKNIQNLALSLIWHYDLEDEAKINISKNKNFFRCLFKKSCIIATLTSYQVILAFQVLQKDSL